MQKIVTADEAVKNIQDGNIIAINGVCTICNPDLLCLALANKYKKTQSPKGLTMWGATALGISMKGAFADVLFKDTIGLIRKVVVGQFSSTPSLAKLVIENKIAGYNLPQGIISHLYRAASGQKPAIISKIGLKTSIDPREDGACVNDKAREESALVKLVIIDEKEYLQYTTPKIDVCFISGSVSDQKGNISFENEAAFVDASSLALATKANNGTVCIQVEKVTDERLHPKSVQIPAKLVDYIVVNPKQMQCVTEKCNPAINGDEIMTSEEIIPFISKMVSVIPGNKKRYDQYIIAKRAYKELRKGDVINLGVGIPGLISTLVIDAGQINDFTLSNEVGLLGGIPLPVPAFGATINAEMITNMATMFDFYDGGNLDGVYVGAAQVSSNGNVGVGKVGNSIFGVGGFINLTQSNKKIVFMTNFVDGKGMNFKFENDKLIIVKDGTVKKFVNQVEQVSFSGEVAVTENQDVLYITERCVFRLTPDGMMIIEIAPGIDLQTQIIDKMDFVPLISKDLIEMDKECF